MELSTKTSRSAPAFKILSLCALALTIGCRSESSARSSDLAPGAHAQANELATASTAMPGATASSPAAAPNAALNPAEPEGAGVCGQNGATCAEHARGAAETAAIPTGSDATNVGKYGAPLGGAPAESLASVLAEPSRYAGHPVRVEGHVRRACTAMGCWMELAESGAADAPACRVIMKDHAFFVPKDSAGANARVEGTLAVRRIEPGQVAHMESEGAEFPRKAPDGSAEELRFIASGVELWRGS
jgi:hypothetical protein